MNGEDYEARKDEHRRDWPGYHDPLCTYAAIYDGGGACPECALIARVREDERGKDELIVANAWNAGWQQGLSAAREAVAALPFVRPAYYGKGVLIHGAEPDFVRGDALAAIDALRGE